MAQVRCAARPRPVRAHGGGNGSPSGLSASERPWKASSPSSSSAGPNSKWPRSATSRTSDLSRGILLPSAARLSRSAANAPSGPTPGLAPRSSLPTLGRVAGSVGRRSVADRSPWPRWTGGPQLTRCEQVDEMAPYGLHVRRGGGLKSRPARQSRRRRRRARRRRSRSGAPALGAPIRPM